MAPTTQKAETRPISFVLHNLATGRAPIEERLVIRPEELVRTEQSRLTTTQTLGGAWTDSFGRGVPTVQISGHTGWGAGDRPDGSIAFQRLHENIFAQWHKQRAEALAAEQDPDLVKLIFADRLDDFVWVVAPQSFVLRRSKSRPLLMQYQISMTWVSDDVSLIVDRDRWDWADSGLSAIEERGAESLLDSLRRMGEFAAAKITGVLGAIKGPFDALVSLTARALSAVNTVMRAGAGVLSAITSGLLGIAGSLARAAANVTHIVASIVSMPAAIKAAFRRVGAAFNNAFCVLANIFRRRAFLPNYDGLYGASNCSSTAGGKPISRYATENPFQVLFPVQTSPVRSTASANAALGRLTNADPVLRPMPLAQLADDLSAVNDGVAVS